MKRNTIRWTIILGLGAILLLVNALVRGAGSAYVRSVPMEFVNVGTAEAPHWVDTASDEALDYDLAAVPAGARIGWQRQDPVSPGDYYAAQARNPQQTEICFSWMHTLGVWAAALFTLFIMSFLYRDNPFYKIAESVVVGVSAAYWMVVGFWDVVVPNLVAKVAPDMVRSWAMPGLSDGADYTYIIPLILGFMLLMRLSPVGSWISRWPLAFIIGSTAGIRLVGFIHADFLSQIRNSIIPLVVAAPDGGGFLFWDSVKNIVLVIGVLCALVYFFFSIEHTGVVGKTAKVGIWFLMVTFGAAFGYTVMGRIALLAIRLEFLFDDWLWLIDPKGERAVAAIHAMAHPLMVLLGLG
jgi:hypothetical protein